MKKTAIIYGTVLAIVLIFFKLVEYYYFTFIITLDMYIGIVAVIFLAVGFIIARRMKKKERIETPPVEPFFRINSTGTSELSEREKEVLLYLASGYTNQEIADKLFVSLNTIKTHLTNIYSKLNVKRRTQAVIRAKELNIIS